MNKRTILALIVVLALAGSMAGIALAQSDGAAVDWWVVAGGGAPTGEGTIALNDTLGQPIVGPSSGDGDVALGAGYWYGWPIPTAYTIYLPGIWR